MDIPTLSGFRPVILTVLCTWLCCTFFFCDASAQKLVNTTGTTVNDNNYIIEYSVGEIATTTLTQAGNTNFITQGLLQPNIKIINPDCNIVNDTINCFPNPVEKMLSVVGRLDWITSYRIYAADGKLVRVAPFINNQINMYNLPGGAYFIKLYPGCNDKFRVLKVIKQ
ncbi:MAG TPA: T9SS type A sorting domain-containing protein [Chitinophagaceae bacterium]|nr:T9SS type A sorting domain-containing protein [Chitinophagaceae bacterium]